MDLRRDHIRLLTEVFIRNGNIRRPDGRRRKKQGDRYKKGAEVRLVASTKGELRRIRSALSKLGFRTGKPYAKGNSIVQPVYGIDQVQAFEDLLKRAR